MRVWFATEATPTPAKTIISHTNMPAAALLIMKMISHELPASGTSASAPRFRSSINSGASDGGSRVSSSRELRSGVLCGEALAERLVIAVNS